MAHAPFGNHLVTAIEAALPRLARAVPLARDGQRFVRDAGASGRFRGALPVHADGPTRIENDGAWVELTPEHRASTEAEVVGKTAVYRDAEPETDIVAALGEGWLEEARILHSATASPSIRYHVAHGPEVAKLRLNGGSVEVVDRTGRIALRSLPAFAVDADGKTHAIAVALESLPTGEMVATFTVEHPETLSYPAVFDPSWVSGTSWPSETLVALVGMWLAESSATTGNVAVIDQNDPLVFPPPADVRPGVPAPSELLVDTSTTVTGSARANRIFLQAGATVTGDAAYNDIAEITGSTVGGSHVTPLSLPLDITTPAMPTITPGTTDVSVDGGTTTPLTAGAYRFVEVKEGTAAAPAVLALSGGVYHFAALDLDDYARVECAAACELRIKGNLLPGSSSFIGAAASAPTVSPSDIQIFVAGEDVSAPSTLDPADTPPSGTQLAASLGPNSTVHAHIFVPDGLLWLKNGVNASGRFAGHDVLVEANATVRRDCDSVDDNNTCTVDTCNLATGQAVHTPVTNGTSCNDGDACTQTDTCQNGACTGSNPVQCSAQDQCHDVGTCNSTTGVCSNPAKPNDTSCNDGDACTQTDTCQSGTCTGSNPVTCSAQDQCHDVGTCNSTTGVCSNPAKPNGTSCNDGDACTRTDSCQSGTCTGSDPVICGAIDNCHDAGICNSATGLCSNPPRPAGASCADGNLCNGDETCDGAGHCNSGTPPTVDDNIVCTIDTCLPAEGVKHRPCSTVDRTVATTLYDAAKFLFTGSDPIQTGVAADTIDPLRVTVLRGKVKIASGTPIMGVTVRVLKETTGSSDYGQTITAADGYFTLAANGGGVLRVSYAKAGYLPVERRIDAAQQDYAAVPDVVMTPPDVASTVVASSAASLQVHRATSVTDARGTRQATLLFLPGTTADLVFPNGSGQSASSLTVHATEFTTGSAGPEAVPLTLPPTSAYTYAVGLNADEAIAAGAKRVEFNQPVRLYLENFLDFPVGAKVPQGFYGKNAGCWKAEKDGRVIQILDLQGGAASIDIDGQGNPASAAALSALGVDPEELTELAILYAPGQKLWRFALNHFSAVAVDGNNPSECATPPCSGPPKPDGPQPNNCDSKDNNASTILCERQALSEEVPVVGTPYSLQYVSDRVPGRAAERTRTIPLGTPPSSVKRVGVEVDIAGQHHFESYTCPAECGPNMSWTFAWDGKDAFGRTLQGGQRAVFSIGYFYAGYYSQAAAADASFGLPGSASSGVPSSDVLVKTTFGDYLGPWDARTSGLGGWSLDVHHAYDPVSRVLHLGSGRDRKADTVASAIHTIGGGQPGGSVGNGGPATAAHLAGPAGLRVTPDGAIVFADMGAQRVRRIDRSGIITTLAGDGTPGFSGDGGPASAAELANPMDVAIGRDGTICIADKANQRVRCIDPETGIIQTVAGNGSRGYAGDGGPATSAKLMDPAAVAFGPDCALYIGELRRVRRVGLDGVITTVAGGASNDPPGRALDMFIGYAAGLAFGADGSLYIADSGAFDYYMRVLRLGTDGMLRTIAGTGAPGDAGDGDLAAAATLNTPRGIAVAADGSLYVAVAVSDPGPPIASGVRRIDANGIITRFIGRNVPGCDNNTYCGENGPVGAAHLLLPWGVATGPTGDSRSLYLADNSGRVLRADMPLPGLSLDDVAIPSEDGSQVFVFTSAGKHKETRDAVTGAAIYSFSYDAAGRLATITDGSGLVTTIAHSSGGDPTKATGPYGQETLFETDGNGFLSKITNPASEVSIWSYSGGGLLAGRTDPRGKSTTYDYDTLGRFKLVHDATGVDRTLVRTEQASGFTVTRTTPEGLVTTFQSQTEADGSTTRTITPPSGHATVVHQSRDGGTTTATQPGGETTTTTLGGDPRFGMLSPVASTTTHTPLGLNRVVDEERLVTLTNPADLLHPATITEKTTVNGKLFTRSYSATTKTWTTTSPMGRVSTTTLDALGRTTVEGTAGLTALSFGYDANGRLHTTTQGTRQTTLDYNSAGWLASTTDPLSHTVTFGRDGAGRMTATTRPDAEVIGTGYDGNGNVTSVTPPGKPSHVLSYSDVNLLEDYLPPDAGFTPRNTHWSWNGDRVEAVMARPDLLTLGHTYDSAGRLRFLVAPTETRTYSYSTATGQLLGIASDAPSLTLGYSWDGSLLTGMTWSGAVNGSVEFQHDNDFRVSVETVNAGGPVSIQYDLDGLLSQAGDLTVARNSQNPLVTGTTLDLVTDTYGYSSFGELSSYEASFDGTPIYTTLFERDALGRITKKTETIGAATTVYEYRYDLAGRLDQVKENGAVARSYTYDANGNRLTKTDSGGMTTGTYDDQDRQLSYGAFTFTYTPSGELATKTDGATTTEYAYDVFGNLKSVTKVGSDVIEYVADPENRRIKKTKNGDFASAWLYKDDLRPIAELDESGDVLSRFVYALGKNVPNYMIQGSTKYRLITDQVGSVRLVVNTSTGAIAQRIDYDEFGVVLSVAGAAFQPCGFAGGLYDPDTGLVRFGARDYDGRFGRWNTRDPLRFEGRSANLYGYADGDPINHRDPKGKDAYGDCQAQCAFSAAAAWSVGFIVCSKYVKGKEWVGCVGGTTALAAGFLLLCQNVLCAPPAGPHPGNAGGEGSWPNYPSKKFGAGSGGACQ